ncbi:MAG TPA: ATP-binding protein [Candidatus Limnocylindrales bacterium]|jgi:PAS domain S-box-containing protein|nr:ATP-binding protein [Candidatus Limnocylindrales bacterium]
MDNAVTLNELSGVGGDDRSAAIRRATALSIIILAITVASCGGLYSYGKHAFDSRNKTEGEARRDMLQRMDRIAISVTAMAAVGGVGCLVPLVTAAALWRRRSVSELQEKAEEWKTAAAALQGQLADLRRMKDGLLVRQADLEAQITQLTTTNARLQEDLDKRNRAERALTQRRQELESSKSVLELHVQARSKELENLQRRYEMILNSAGEGICGLDIEGKATFVNPTVAKLTRRPIAELIGKTEQEIFHPKGAATNMNGGSTVPVTNPGEQVFYREDGSSFPVEFVKTPLNENGRVVGSVLMFKDITERKRVEETLAQKAAELTRSNAELEQFAFVASHDLQEPLRKIQAFGDRLKVKVDGAQSPEVKDYLDRMQSAAARMRTLINDLLAFSRVIRSSEPFVEVDLGVITREVLSDLEVRIEKTGAKIDVGVLPVVDADPMQMRQLLLNLISNALKFQPPGGTPVIKISARSLSAASGEQLCELSVQDNGIGFDEKYLDKIFAVFQRLHGRTEYEGTGVGLAVCRRIVDRHHGSIIARSQPGQGATFLVTLPVRQPKPETAS